MSEFNSDLAEIIHLPQEECSLALKRAYDEYGAEAFLGQLGKTIGDTQSIAILKKLTGFVHTCFPQAVRPIRTIGIFFPVLSLGGVQRVITTQFPIFHELGLKVVFFWRRTYGPTPVGKTYPLPDYVKQVELPILKASSTTFQEDISKTARLIQAEEVDVFYNHDIYHHSTMIWLPMILKTILKIPYFLHFHNIFSKMLVLGKTYDFLATFECIKMADLLISLSRIDQLYFSASGINTIYMPNTFLLPGLQPLPRKQAAGHTILYLARIVFQHKRPLDTVRIMEKVINRLPDAKLLIVGCGQERDEKILQNAIAESPAAKQIEFCGPTLDVASYYQRADVFIMTSSHEGFPITLLEAQAFGLPVVSYDMPYLEITRHSPNGILTVPQEDAAAAANAIVNILTDPELYHKKSCCSIANAKFFAEFDLKGLWQKIFTNWQDLPQPEMKGDEWGVLLATLHQHIHWNAMLLSDEKRTLLKKITELEKLNLKDRQDAQNKLNKLLQEQNDLCKKLKKQKQKLEQQKQKLEQQKQKLEQQKQKLESFKRMKNSFSYRLGRALTWLPRKVRGGLRCLKDHGFGYTFKRLLQKIGHVFSK